MYWVGIKRGNLIWTNYKNQTKYLSITKDSLILVVYTFESGQKYMLVFLVKSYHN